MLMERFARWAVFLALAAGALAISGEVLRGLDHWGRYDWDYHFFQGFSIYRSLLEFREPPLWNPWYMGGVPAIGNFQSPFPSPWLLLDLGVGPVVAIKLKIVAHYAIGVAGMYWMARQLRLSRLASVYASGTFFFSTWLALRVHSGHLTYLSTAYLPYVVGFLARSRARRDSRDAIWAGGIVALMILQGGVYDVIFTAFVSGFLALAWSLQGRTTWPLVVAVLIGAWGFGLAAVKLLPVASYMRENSRTTEVGGNPAYLGQDPGAKVGGKTLEDFRKNQEVVETVDEVDVGPEGSERPLRLHKPPSKWDLLTFAVKAFLGREQRSNRYYKPLQTFGWHEYGVYIGPLAVGLAALSVVLAWRTSWPWLVTAALCFVAAGGNFGWFAPWTLIHRLPVFGSMHCPSRFLMPCIFAATVAAGYALDAIRQKLGGSRTGRRTRFVDSVLGLLVAAALVDSVAVARSSIRGVFPLPPPVIEPRQPVIVTSEAAGKNMTQAMLANYCSAHGYEPIHPKVWVTACEAPAYKGEAYLDSATPGAKGGLVEIVDWSPNTVVVRASSPTAGRVVLNRNWGRGWRTDPPYLTEVFQGLIASPIEPGEHVIRFVYWPSVFLIGTGISVATLALAISLLVRGTEGAGVTSQDP